MKNLWALLLLGWVALGSWWYVCKRCNCCGTEISAPVLSKNPYDFDWNSSKMKLNPDFDKWKSNLLSAGGMGDTLVVFGYYGQNETGGEKLGLARAEAVKKTLENSWDASRIVCRAKMVADLGEKNAPFMAANFDWKKAKINKNESTIISQGSDFIILFPFRSAVKEVDAKVDAFLKDLSEKNKNSNLNISIVGHTDNVGEDAPNKALGQARADFIAKILKKNGIAAGRISTNSMGESQPAATNDTDEGRHQNRRVVISVK
jgi:outer membrane protein OmpA-like peptidoglycan-associated protein